MGAAEPWIAGDTPAADATLVLHRSCFGIPSQVMGGPEGHHALDRYCDIGAEMHVPRDYQVKRKGVSRRCLGERQW